MSEEPCCIAAAHGQACTCRRADFWPVNMPRPEPSHDWRELHQDGSVALALKCADHLAELFEAWWDNEIDGAILDDARPVHDAMTRYRALRAEGIWRELHQDEQPRLSDGYTAIMFLRPGVYLVAGPGPVSSRGDYHEGIEEGWKAGAAQERRIWEQAVKLALGYIPPDLENRLAEVREGVEGHD